MRLIDSIRAEWCEHGQFRKRYASLTLDEAGLMLGAGTVLAKRVNGTLDIDGDEDRARIFALLTTAYGPAIQASVLGHIERAAKAEREDKRALAGIHLAHAGLPPVADDNDACYRLFLFEKLIEEGTAPETILKALRPIGELTERGNPYHDRRGLFTTPDGAVSPAADKQPKQHSTAWKIRPNAAFRQKIAERESTAQRPDNGYGAESPSGKALGRYQMQKDALIDGGWKDRDGTWSEKANEAGIRTDKDFLANPDAQEQAFTDALQAYHDQLSNDGARSYVGQTVKDSTGNPLVVAEAGILAAAHKQGARAVRQYLDPVARTHLKPQQLKNIEGRLRYAADIPYDSNANAFEASTGAKGRRAQKK